MKKGSGKSKKGAGSSRQIQSIGTSGVEAAQAQQAGEVISKVEKSSDLGVKSGIPS